METVNVDIISKINWLIDGLKSENKLQNKTKKTYYDEKQIDSIGVFESNIQQSNLNGVLTFKNGYVKGHFKKHFRFFDTLFIVNNECIPHHSVIIYCTDNAVYSSVVLKKNLVMDKFPEPFE